MSEEKCIFEPSDYILNYEKKQNRDQFIVCLGAYSFLISVSTYLVIKVFGL